MRPWNTPREGQDRLFEAGPRAEARHLGDLHRDGVGDVVEHHDARQPRPVGSLESEPHVRRIGRAPALVGFQDEKLAVLRHGDRRRGLMAGACGVGHEAKAQHARAHEGEIARTVRKAAVAEGDLGPAQRREGAAGLDGDRRRRRRRLAQDPAQVAPAPGLDAARGEGRGIGEVETAKIAVNRRAHAASAP
jgi:hypothetical protein